MKLLAATLALVLAAVCPAARADIWEDATAEPESAEDLAYAEAMQDGDQAARLGAAETSSSATTRKLILKAAREYERAAEIRPRAAEPHWRAATVLFEMFVDCANTMSTICDTDVDPELYRRILGHWDASEERSPLDPRIKTILFERAILRTKLATDEDLADARDDYEELLDRGSSLEIGIGQAAQTLGNLAETYMMLGDVDHAITRYHDAILIDTSTSQLYGLAVAFDRDEQGAKAREIMAALGEAAFEDWWSKVNNPPFEIFYVPEGEAFYYAGLAHESLGHPRDAMVAWQRYLSSGAHPQFQPRAQAHLDKLKAQVASGAVKVKLSTPPPPEDLWSE